MKTRDLDIIYNKIADQSKKIFFFKNICIKNNFKHRLEIFELNLIIILWYMKLVDLKKIIQNILLVFL